MSACTAGSKQAQLSRSAARIRRGLCPAPHITACSPLPGAPLSGLGPSRPSIFMFPMTGSMALRRLIIALSALVMPRRCPERRVRTPSTSTPRWPLSTMAVCGGLSVSARMHTSSCVSAGVWPS